MSESKFPKKLQPFCAKDIDCEHQWFVRGKTAYCRKCGAETLEHWEVKPKARDEQWSWAP